jgi:hypothetical protein
MIDAMSTSTSFPNIGASHVYGSRVVEQALLAIYITRVNERCS